MDKEHLLKLYRLQLAALNVPQHDTCRLMAAATQLSTGTLLLMMTQLEAIFGQPSSVKHLTTPARG